MPVKAEELDEIAQMIAAGQAAGGLIAALRDRFPTLVFTRCDASDVSEAPALSSAHFDLHLLDSRDHCVAITSDPETATGVVLAQRRTS